MVSEDERKASDVVVFSPADRVSLNDLDSDAFYAKFREFSRLLVERNERLVLAASRSGNCTPLLEAFKLGDPTIDERDLIFWSGPKALSQTSDANFANRFGRSTHPSDRDR